MKEKIVAASIGFVLAFLFIWIMVTQVQAAGPVDPSGVADSVYHDALCNASNEDIEAIEQVVYWEAARADCDTNVCAAVVETILNRYIDPKHRFKGDSIYDICHAKGQFVCKPYRTDEYTEELISDSICLVIHEGPSVLPSTNYLYFATKMQSCANNHVWIGDRKDNGSPKKGKGMYFAEPK